MFFYSTEKTGNKGRKGRDYMVPNHTQNRDGTVMHSLTVVHTVLHGSVMVVYKTTTFYSSFHRSTTLHKE